MGKLVKKKGSSMAFYGSSTAKRAQMPKDMFKQLFRQ
jgi:hypothetical protein